MKLGSLYGTASIHVFKKGLTLIMFFESSRAQNVAKKKNGNWSFTSNLTLKFQKVGRYDFIADWQSGSHTKIVNCVKILTGFKY